MQERFVSAHEAWKKVASETGPEWQEAVKMANAAPEPFSPDLSAEAKDRSFDKMLKRISEMVINY